MNADDAKVIFKTASEMFFVSTACFSNILSCWREQIHLSASELKNVFFCWLCFVYLHTEMSHCLFCLRFPLQPRT